MKHISMLACVSPDVARKMILSASAESGGNRSKIHGILGVSRATLYRLITDLGLAEELGSVAESLGFLPWRPGVEARRKAAVVRLVKEKRPHKKSS